MPSPCADPVVRTALNRLSWVLHGEESIFVPGPEFDPALDPPTREWRLTIDQQGGVLAVVERSDSLVSETDRGSPLALLRSVNGLVQIIPVEDNGERDAAF